MHKEKKIFCIIPAFNEEKNIASVVKDVRHVVDNVVVVDDCSTDKTVEYAKEAGAIVLSHVVNRGQGAALETGNQYALAKGADIVAHFDADGQFRVQDLERGIKEIERSGVDVVFGSRFLGIESNMPFLKAKIIFPLARIVNKLFFNINLSDPQSGFRILKRNVIKKIKIENDGAAHCSEILAKIFKNNFKVKEVAILVEYNRFGQSFFSGRGRGQGGIRILMDLMFHRILK